MLATTSGVQPVLTLLWVERGLPLRRFAGLLLALSGLVLVVYDSIVLSRMPWRGVAFAFAALLSVTAGSLMQKRLAQPPLDVLPLQYGAGLAMCVALLPWMPWQVRVNAQLIVYVAWLGLVISVVATLLLYRLITAGDIACC
ncbi:hypothetical protein J7E70_27315 [Variovorax paradoxus]|nr:hypothetical protein [Variovorax paradoxus]MBT2304150.1 hypothetical protein [Variovorax paradoxus]